MADDDIGSVLLTGASGLTYEFKNKPAAADVFDASYLPADDARMVK